LGQHQCYQHSISIIFLVMHFRCIALYYYFFIPVIFHYDTVSVHDTGNHNMVNSVTTKCWGNVREFYVAGEWSP